MMTTNQILIKEFQFVTNWTGHLITDLDAGQWKITPTGVGTNIHWIAGHIMHDKYWHGLSCISEPSKTFRKQFDIGHFEKYFRKDSDPLAYLEERPSRDTILESLNILDAEILKITESISEDELEKETIEQNPVAKTKYESLSFAIKHQMWHNGQIALIRRVLKKNAY